MDQRAAQAELLPHAAGQLVRRTVGEGREPGARPAVRRSRHRARRGPARTAGRRTRCSPARSDRDRGSCRAPAAYRRCAGRSRRGGAASRMSPPRHFDAAVLDPPCPGDDAQAATICRRRPDRSGRPCSPRECRDETPSSARDLAIVWRDEAFGDGRSRASIRDPALAFLRSGRSQSLRPLQDSLRIAASAHRPRRAARCAPPRRGPRARSGSIRTRTRNISLSRSVLVSTIFGVNCAWLARNDDLRRNRPVRDRRQARCARRRRS